MSKRVAANVKSWRRRWKSRIIIAMGGRCGCCGYDKSEEALQLHHVDPGKKEVSFSFMRAQPRAAESLIPELLKCVLVCSNCHFEIHAGITPNPPLVFDEAKYRMLLSSIGRTPPSQGGKAGSIPASSSNNMLT